MGIGNTTVAAALCAGLFGGDAALWTGPGTGVAGAALAAKCRAVADAVARHVPLARDPFELLRRLGGLELAAIAGAVMAARLGRVPVVLDGFASTAAAAVLFAVDPQALDHCIVAHVSAEPGHRRLLERIGKAPLLDLGMRLGEASGADARPRPVEGGGGLSQRHGDLRRRRRQRAWLTRQRAVGGVVPHAAQAVAAIERGPSAAPAR